MNAVTNKKQTVLIVDDSKANILALAGLLKSEWSVQIATNGNTALEIAHKKPHPSIILLDIMMPDIDGYEVCRRLKNNSETKDIPVIFVSAMTSEEDVEKGLAVGGIDYITKPFNSLLVKAKVRNHLALQAAYSALHESNQRTLAILDNIRAFVYVIDNNTYEILYMNKKAVAHWGDHIGSICYKSLQKNKTSPCSFCNKQLLTDEHGNPTEGITWEYLNELDGNWYECHESALQWLDGQIVRLQVAITINSRK